MRRMLLRVMSKQPVRVIPVGIGWGQVERMSGQLVRSQYRRAVVFRQNSAGVCTLGGRASSQERIPTEGGDQGLIEPSRTCDLDLGFV